MLLKFLPKTWGIKNSLKINITLTNRVSDFILNPSTMIWIKPFRNSQVNGCYLKTSEIQSLYLARAKFLKVLGNHSKSLEKLKPAGTVQILSKKLLNNLALEECSGDFCKYEFLAPEKEMLKPKILEYLGQNIMNHNQKVLGSEFGVIFISFNLKSIFSCFS